MFAYAWFENVEFRVWPSDALKIKTEGTLAQAFKEATAATESRKRKRESQQSFNAPEKNVLDHHLY